VFFSVCSLNDTFLYPQGIRIQTTHSDVKRKYTVWGVSSISAEKLQFEVEDGATGRKFKTTVAEYFKDTYKLHLRYCFVTPLFFINVTSLLNNQRSNLNISYACLSLLIP